jgi:hypothetical protein
VNEVSVFNEPVVLVSRVFMVLFGALVVLVYVVDVLVDDEFTVPVFSRSTAGADDSCSLLA